MSEVDVLIKECVLRFDTSTHHAQHPQKAARPAYGSFINCVTRDAAFFRLGFTFPPPLVTLTFPRISASRAVFTAVRLLSVYLGLA